MAYRGAVSERSPQIAAAREIAERFGQDQVIVLMVSRRHGTIRYASYGRTRRLCAEARRIADRAYEAVFECFSRPLFGGPDGE